MPKCDNCGTTEGVDPRSLSCGPCEDYANFVNEPANGEHIDKLLAENKLTSDDIQALATWIGLSNGMISGGEAHSNTSLKALEEASIVLDKLREIDKRQA